jgi:hypothetical protein
MTAFTASFLGDAVSCARRDAATTPTGRLVTTADIVSATAFPLENPAMNGVDLRVDGGTHAT